MLYNPLACSNPNLDPYPPAINNMATSPLPTISIPISLYYYLKSYDTSSSLLYPVIGSTSKVFNGILVNSKRSAIL